MMRVGDVMVRNVATIDEAKSLRDAAKRMAKGGIGSLVVTKKEKPVGIVTDTDLIKAIADGKSAATVKVKGVMSSPLITGVEGLELEDAVKLMVLHGIKRLPVMKGTELVGIVTMTDFARYEPMLHDMLRKALKAANSATKARFEKVLIAREPPTGMYG